MFSVENGEKIVSGPEYNGPVLWGSVAEHLIPKMKSQPKDSISQVDYATNESITSHMFLQECLEVAEGLIKLGLKTGDVVAFLCSNSIPSIAAAVGIMFSGGVFAPIDVTLKSYELQHLFKQFQPKFIICETALAREIQKGVLSINLNAKIILVDAAASGEFYSINDIKTKVDLESYTPRKIADPKKDIAMIGCSSGTTGMPKGITLSHFSILLNLTMTDVSVIPEEFSAALILSPLYWISGIFVTLTSCFHGYTRYIPKSLKVEDIMEAGQKCKPFYIFTTPATLCAMVEHPNFQKYNLSSVRLIISAGAVLGEAATAKIKNIWKGVAIASCYGLTETCGGITGPTGGQKMGAVGKLLPDVKVKVVDLTTGESLGPNKTGECRVKSTRLMNGYYNNEEEKSPFDDQGWLCTGDLVYYDEEGVFYVVGRRKETISYLNFEIPPAEIESFIISLPGVKDVAVVPVPDESVGNLPRALVVRTPDSKITAQDIINEVKAAFSERKHLKAGVQFVDALPRSQVGKLRRMEAQKMIYDEKYEVYLDKTK